MMSPKKNGRTAKLETTGTGTGGSGGAANGRV